MQRLILLAGFLPFILSVEHNPDVDLDTPQIARRHGYSAESHYVQTQDGYILTLHRIPGPKTGQRGGQPVFLQHGTLCSSADWVLQGNDSLAFMLADAGYDVWLGNARGNTYSKAHVNLAIDSAQFWNFSWHEMGVYDLPAAISYVSDITEKPGEILYIGHSMGTTMFFVFAALEPQLAKQVKFMVGLAPVAYLTNTKSRIRYLTPFTNGFEWLTQNLGLNQFSPSKKIMKFLAYDCELFKIKKKSCDNLIFTLCGFEEEEFNEKILPLVLSHDPAGTSTKAIVHYAQEIKNGGRFQEFDYGPEGNMIQYGTWTPPEYLGNVRVKTYLMYAQNDLLTSYLDVLRLSQTLDNNVGVYKVPLDAFSHMDFLFGKHAVQVVYKPIMEVLMNHTEGAD